MTDEELDMEEWADWLGETSLSREEPPLRDERMLEGSRMTDRADAHAHIARVLGFPPGEGLELGELEELSQKLKEKEETE